MKRLQIICYLIGISQIILGLLYLFAPAFFINWQGLHLPPQDTNYPLAMFSARLLVFGAGMFVIARQPVANRFWFDGMIAIQAIDLVAGLFYTITGVVSLGSSSVPMFNATLFIILMSVIRKDARQEAINA